MDSFEDYTQETEIADVSGDRPHVVILGAGASFAAMPNGDRHGHPLPVMVNLIETLGLNSILKQCGVDESHNANFEEVYASLCDDPKHTPALREIASRIEHYFSNLELPDAPTIYDYLVLSLRPKDIIATFNWDPFLFQACQRNHRVAAMPRLAFLHGNVAVGSCASHRTKGPKGSGCPSCGEPLAPSRLLYPISKKDYANDPFIAAEWGGLRTSLRNAFGVTFFGYGAPTSDVEAVNIMKEAWGQIEERELEQTEVIDIKPEADLLASWSPFIHTHHYDIRRDYWSSWIHLHPRRTCEAWAAQYLDARFITENPVPNCSDLRQLHRWFSALVAVER